MTFFTIVFFEQRPWCIIGYGVPKEILFLSLLYTHLLLSTRFKLLYRSVLHPDGALDKQQDYKMRRYEGLAPDQLGETNFKWQMTLHDSSWYRDSPQINLLKTYLKATIFNFIFLYSLLIIPSNIAKKPFQSTASLKVETQRGLTKEKNSHVEPISNINFAYYYHQKVFGIGHFFTKENSRAF